MTATHSLPPGVPALRHRLTAWVWLRFGLFPQRSKSSQLVMSRWMAERLTEHSDDSTGGADRG